MSEQMAAPDLRGIGDVYLDTCGVCENQIVGDRCFVRNPRITRCHGCDAAICGSCQDQLMTCSTSYCKLTNLCPACTVWTDDNEEPYCRQHWEERKRIAAELARDMEEHLARVRRQNMQLGELTHIQPPQRPSLKAGNR